MYVLTVARASCRRRVFLLDSFILRHVLRASMRSSFRKRRPVRSARSISPANDIHVVSSFAALHAMEPFRIYAM